MKMLKLVLLIITCVTLSTAYYEPHYPGMAHAAQPPGPIPDDILKMFQECANQQCEICKYTLLCQIATAMKLRPYIRLNLEIVFFSKLNCIERVWVF